MPGRTGLELIRDLAAAVPEGERPQVLMMTAHATVENAIEAMKLGAYDYLQKPFEVDELLVAVRRALEHQSLSRQHRYLLSEREEEFDHYGIVGRSRAIEELLRKIELVARSKSTVLVTGETGTGKELVARAIHARSAQHDMPLIKVNCAAIPEALLESELFGHVKGAFTGATANRRGRFALADGGTIFLDEIGTLALPVQAKLLRVLQEREFEPVGSRAHGVGGRARDRGHEPRPAGHGGGRALPGGPLLPPERHPRRAAAAARAAGGRPAPRRALRAEARAAGGAADRRRRRRPPSSASRPTAGRATCGSSRTRSSGRWCSRRGPVIDAASISMLEPPAAAPSGGLPSVRLHENVEWAEQESVRRALRQASGVKKDAAELLGISQRALSYYLGKYKVE